MNLNRVTAGPRSVAAVLIALVTSTMGAPQTQQPLATRPGTRVCALHDFGTQPADALAPVQTGAIALGNDGLYYSTSSTGGKSTVTANLGTIFRFSPAASRVEVLYSFDNTPHGAGPMGGLVKASDGYLYGTTSAGGLFKANDQGAMKYGAGTLFRFQPGSAAPEELHTFRYGDMTGIKPEVCPPKLPCHYSPQQRMNAAAGMPLTAPVLASDGNLYGVTGGAIGFPNLGILYKVAPYKGESGITGLCIGGPMPSAETVLTDQQLRDQCMFNGKYGNLPFGLTAGSHGELYGTTIQVSPTSNGTVFKAEIPSGKVTTLYNFSDPKSGSMPYGVTLASDGKLYGTTKQGGPLYGPGNAGAGVVFRLSPAGGNFEIIHAFNGTTEGAHPVADLIEAKSPNGSTYLYGSTATGGALRGVLFRLVINMTGPPNPSDPFAYQVLHVFSNQWDASGAFPTSNMVAADDPDYGMTFYGATSSGGTVAEGVLFRLRGVDLPNLYLALDTPIFSLRSGYKHTGAVVTIPGQAQPTTIDVYAGSVAQVGSKSPADTFTDNGFMIKTGNCRNPHVLQFIYREKIGADGQHLGGSYAPTGRPSYPLTTDPAHPNWNTDSGGKPNAYYDQQNWAPVWVGPMNLTVLDQPNFDGVTYMPGSHETWRATLKDYVICNCQVVGEVHWTREVPWIVDLPSAPNVTVDINKGHQGPARYINVSIDTITDDPNLIDANKQVRTNGFYPLP